MASVPQKREQLKEIIKTQGIFLRDVTLSSNVRSDVYYDIKTVVNNSEGAVLIGELMLNKIKELFPAVKSVGGLESGSLQIATAIVFFSNQLRDGKLNSFFVRKEPKKHGLEKKVEGIRKSPLVVVDDVVTTGQSVIDAVNALMAEGLSPIGIISVIDREDERKIEELKNGTLKYDSLFKHSEFEDFIRTKKEQLKN